MTDLSGQGQLVRLVLADLLATHRVPPAALIAITRAPDKVAEFQRRGVRVLPADFESADSVRQAFSGVRSAHYCTRFPHWLIVLTCRPHTLRCTRIISLYTFSENVRLQIHYSYYRYVRTTRFWNTYYEYIL